MGEVEKVIRTSVGVSMGTCGIRTARFTEDSTWADDPPFEDWQMPPTPQDVARTVRTLVDRHDAPESLAIAYGQPGARAALGAAIAEEYVSDVHTLDETDAALEYLRPTLPSAVKTVALFDVGETGLAVDIVDVESGRSYGGVRSPVISGREFDRVVCEHVLGLGIYRPPTTDDDERALVAFCRGIKEALSTFEAAHTPGGDILLLERRIFELSITRGVEEAAGLVRILGLQAEFFPELVVVFGGSARIPLLGAVLERYLGLPVLVPEAPELTVARGAALYAQRLDSAPVPEPASRRISRTRLAAFALPAVAVVGAAAIVFSTAFGNAEQPLGTQVLTGESADATSTTPTTIPAPATSIAPPTPTPPTTADAPAPAAVQSNPRPAYVPPAPPPPPPPPTLPLPQIPGIQMPVIPLPVLPPLPFG